MLPILNIALRSCRQFGDYLVQTLDKQEPSQVSADSNEKLLNHLEEVAFKSLMDAMKKAHPSHYVAEPGEVLTKPRDDSWHFLGFHNPSQLLRKIPFSGFSIVHRHQGKTQNAIVFNPFSGDEFTASRGGGAALNGRRMRCTNVKSLSEARIASNTLNRIQSAANPDAIIEMLAKMSRETQSIQVTGCDVLDMCMAASGQIDGTLLLSADRAELEAALLIAQESGLLTGPLSGAANKQANDNLVAANPKLYKLLIQAFAGYDSKL